MSSSAATVSVIIPAYNAQATIEQTLKSVLLQTHSALEVIVIDDGSEDGTGDIVRRFMRKDSRVRLIRQDNAGVAAARNAGLAAASSDFIAPIDADDVWHPRKIEKQMKVMLAGGRSLGFVYAAYRHIDPAGNVISSVPCLGVSGSVLFRHIAHNFVGNGSSLLIRRSALEAVGGYDTSLHRRGAQGSEDYLAQLKLASLFKVGVVPEYLVGYRVTPRSMSSRGQSMLRSRMLVYQILKKWNPSVPDELLRPAQAISEIRCGVSLVRSGEIAQGTKLATFGFRHCVPGQIGGIVRNLATWILSALVRRLPRKSRWQIQAPRKFEDLEPTEEFRPVSNTSTRMSMLRLAARDQARPRASTLVAPRPMIVGGHY